MEVDKEWLATAVADQPDDTELIRHLLNQHLKADLREENWQEFLDDMAKWSKLTDSYHRAKAMITEARYRREEKLRLQRIADGDPVEVERELEKERQRAQKMREMMRAFLTEDRERLNTSLDNYVARRKVTWSHRQ